MHVVRRTAVFGLALLLVAGAASAGKKGKGDDAPTEPGTYTDWNEDLDRIEIVETFALADYQRLVVGEFDSADTPLPDADDNSLEPVKAVLANVEGPLVEGLREELSGVAVSTGDAGSQAGTLLLRGKVLEMNPGSRAARYWAGFGAGAAGAKLEGEIVDAASGRVLLRFTQERRSGAGMGGGKYDKLLERSLRAIGKDLGAGLQRF